MGRIKSTMVKRAAEQLLAQNPEKFSDSFEYNKRILGNSIMPSKKIRNKIAGYMARLTHMENTQKAKNTKATTVTPAQ